MDTFLRRRNANNNLVFRDTVILEPLYQPTYSSNNRMRSYVLLDVYKSEVLTSVLLKKRGAVLSELFKVSSQLRGFATLGGETYHNISRIL